MHACTHATPVVPIAALITPIAMQEGLSCCSHQSVSQLRLFGLGSRKRGRLFRELGILLVYQPYQLSLAELGRLLAHHAALARGPGSAFSPTIQARLPSQPIRGWIERCGSHAHQSSWRMLCLKCFEPPCKQQGQGMGGEGRQHAPSACSA
jgi:hypothetical protein